MNKHAAQRMAAWRGIVLALASIGAITAVSGCVSPGSLENRAIVPDEQGIYAYTGEKLVRLDGDVEWERKTWGQRSDLPADSEIIIRDAALAGSAGQSVGLRRVAWVRSTISDQGKITPVSGSKWINAPLPALEVPLDHVEQTESGAEVVRLRPRQSLQPGLYAVYAKTGGDTRNARFGVAWPEADKQAYAASVCVDRHIGADTAYRPCQEQGMTGADDRLQIFLVRPEQRQTSGGRSTVISGVILNNSERVQPVPLLAAELRDAQGRALTRWRFNAERSELEPGQSTSFRTEVGAGNQQVHSVNVNFASTQASNQE